MLPERKTSFLTSLKKAQGMLAKLEKMATNDEYCGDIAQQVNATMGLLKSMNREVLVSHLHTCGAHKLMSQKAEERQEFIDELLKLTHVTTR